MLQTQCAHAAEVVDSTEVVKSVERFQLWLGLARPGMRTGDDAPAPGIGLGVCQGVVKT